MKIRFVKILLPLFLAFNVCTALYAQNTPQTSKQDTSQFSKQKNPSHSIVSNSAFGGIPIEDSMISKGTPPIALEIAVLALLGLLPWIIMMLTSYIKIVVVISLLRSALGVQQTPPSQVINGIALILTLYIMFPTGLAMYDAAKEKIEQNPPQNLVSSETAPYIMDVIGATKEPMKDFLKKNANATHVGKFYQLAYRIFPEEYRKTLNPNDFIILAPAFVTSQLKDAFSIGVLIYLPFFVIDLVTSNILLAMGMMMLSPLTISLPLKLLLLVMLDGWTILIEGLVMTFR